VRQYGVALLRGTPEEREARSRHARWVARLAAEAEPLLFSPARGRTVARVQHDVDEVRAALAWAAHLEGGRPAGEPMTAVRIAGALGWFWLSGVPWEEGRALLAAALAAADAEAVPDAARPTADRVALGTLFYPATGLQYFAGDAGAMLALTARELALWDTVDADLAGAGAAADPALRLAAVRGRTLAHQLRGLALAMRGDHAEAVRQLDRSVAVAGDAGERWLHAVMTMRRALVRLMGGDHAGADADYRAAIPLLRAVGERWFLSLTHEGMAANALAGGDLAAAAAEGRRAVRALREERDEWFVSRGLDTLAAVLAAAPGGPAQAGVGARLHGAAHALRRRCGAAVIGTDQARHAAADAALRARLGGAAFAAAHAEGEAMTLDDAFALVDDDAAFAGVAGPSAAPTPAEPSAAVDAPRPGAPADAPARGGALRLDVLGPFAMARDGRELPADALPVGKARELLLFLVLHERATREQVGLALWPDASAAQVRNTFHVTLHHLRRLLGDAAWVVFDQGAYRLDRLPAPGAALDADVDAVLAAADRLRAAARRQERVAAEELDALGRALARARGDLAAGVAAEDWLEAHRARVRAAWADGMDVLARQHAAAGRPADALAAAERLVAHEPLRESAHRVLMEALAALGEPGRALAHYDALAALLDREVGARPARETQALRARLAA